MLVCVFIRCLKAPRLREHHIRTKWIVQIGRMSPDRSFGLGRKECVDRVRLLVRIPTEPYLGLWRSDRRQEQLERSLADSLHFLDTSSTEPLKRFDGIGCMILHSFEDHDAGTSLAPDLRCLNLEQ